MLIIPIENKPDWSNPPWVTVLLVLVNFAIFLSLQSADGALVERASKHYVQQNLVIRERYLVEQFLRVNHPAVMVELETLAGRPEYFATLSAIAFSFSEIDQIVRDFWLIAEINTDKWQEDRRIFEGYRAKLSSFRWGLVASQPKWYSFVTYAFLHGGWGHIVGNMIFLFIFGFVLETVLGRTIYVAGYLLTAVLSGIAYQVVNLESQAPLVGASGAISALMGAYIVFYGLRKIRFFYSLGFYFGEIKTYALAILPLWILKEVYGYFYLQDQVAQSAHLGGLAAGAGCMLLWQRAFPKQRRPVAAPEVAQEQERIDAGLKVIATYVDQLELDKAIAECQRLLRYDPTHIDVLRAYFRTAQLRPKNKAFQQASFDILKTLTRIELPDDEHRELVQEVIDTYRRLSPNGPVLNHEVLIARLSAWLLKHGGQDQASELLVHYLKRNALGVALKPSLTLALAYHRRQRHEKEVNRFANWLSQISS